MVRGKEAGSSHARAQALAFRRHGLGQRVARGPGERYFGRKPGGVLPAYAGVARVSGPWHRTAADETADEAIPRISPAHSGRRGEGGFFLPQMRIQARGKNRFDVGVQGQRTWVVKPSSTTAAARAAGCAIA